jgi:hypothetical protein
MVQGYVKVGRSNCLSEIQYYSPSEGDLEDGNMMVDGPIPGNDAKQRLPATGALPDSDVPTHGTCDEISYKFRGQLFLVDGQEQQGGRLEAGLEGPTPKKNSCKSHLV